MYGKAYSNLLISENAFNTVCRLEEELAPVFRRIESIECENEAKVLTAFHKNRVAAHYFNPTTGYGYDDIGRDNLDKVFADAFGAESAIVSSSLFPELMRFLLFFQGCFGTAIYSLQFPESHMILWLMR